MIGVYGTKQDAPKQAWRPTLALCTSSEFPVHRLELLHYDRYAKQAARFAKEIQEKSPHATEVRLHRMRFSPYDYEQAMRGLGDFADEYARRFGWNLEREDYLVHGGVGSHFHQTALFLLVQGHEIPGRLVFVSPPSSERPQPPSIVDLQEARFAILDPRRQQAAEASAESLLKGRVETKNVHFNALIHEIRTVAESSTDPVLLGGETGVGKTFVAKHIHELRRRAHLVSDTFVEVNCATLRGEFVQSTLFGYVKGAFTGAAKDKAGLLEAADGGLLFLDEIGELDLQTQAMLLKAVEEKVFLPLGGTKAIQSNFQLVGATNRDLLREIELGRFRADLYARIAYWTWTIPPLRSRPEDIEGLVGRFLDQWAAERERVRLARRAHERLLTFSRSPAAIWPWNLRDLIRAVRRMASRAVRGTISESIVRQETERLQREWELVPGAEAVRDHFSNDEDLVRRHLAPARFKDLQPIEIPQLAYALQVCSRSATQAAAGRQLFTKGNMSHRIRMLLERYGLRFSDLQGSGDT